LALILHPPVLRSLAGDLQNMTRTNRDEHARNSSVDSAGSSHLDQNYHDRYDGENSYEDSFEKYFDAKCAADFIKIVWGAKPPFKLLDCGSANGLTLAEFADIGIEAWGVENNEHIYGRTAPEWQLRNVLGNVCSMPFADDEFDFLYDTSLCYVPPQDVDRALREMARVCKKGLIFRTVARDMTQEFIDAHDLFYGVATLMTLREWSERLLQNGFRPATTNPLVLNRTFKREVAVKERDYTWYPSPASMQYCFYTKIPKG
jgi:SAM-dependent methyltransferase